MKTRLRTSVERWQTISTSTPLREEGTQAVCQPSSCCLTPCQRRPARRTDSDLAAITPVRPLWQHFPSLFESRFTLPPAILPARAHLPARDPRNLCRLPNLGDLA